MARYVKKQGGSARYVGMEENGPWRVLVKPYPSLNPPVRSDPYWMQPGFKPPILMSAVYGGEGKANPALAYAGMASLGAAGAWAAGAVGIKSNLLLGALLGAGAYAVVREWGGPGGLYTKPLEPKPLEK